MALRRKCRLRPSRFHDRPSETTFATGSSTNVSNASLWELWPRIQTSVMVCRRLRSTLRSAAMPTSSSSTTSRSRTPKKVRVAGPFTVESLSPHRSLSFGDSPESLSETKARQGRRRAEVRAVDPRQPREGRHPERPPAGADRVRGVRDVCGRLHPGDRPARQRDGRGRPRRGSRSRSARSTAPSARRT